MTQVLEWHNQFDAQPAASGESGVGENERDIFQDGFASLPLE
jgi:hypothetical protein